MDEYEVEEQCKFRMSIDYPRKTKESVKIKITASGNTKEEFQENLEYLKGVAFTNM